MQVYPVLLTITQGITYPPIVIILAGDYSAWIPQGQIRSSPKADSVLESWQFQSSYSTGEGKTYIYASLGASQTERLPIPIQAEREASKPEKSQQWNKIGATVWCTDIELHHPQQPDTVMQVLPLSFVRVIPGVTR